MILSHKIALDPNNAQRTYFARAVGTARFAYNWALAQWQAQYQAHLGINDSFALDNGQCVLDGSRIRAQTHL